MAAFDQANQHLARAEEALQQLIPTQKLATLGELHAEAIPANHTREAHAAKNGRTLIDALRATAAEKGHSDKLHERPRQRQQHRDRDDHER